MASTMSTEQWRAFVMKGTRTGKLAVTRADGRPHVTPIWFVLDGEDLVLTTEDSSVKGRALRRDPRVSLCVDDDTPPYSFVIIEGEATLSDDLAELRRWATVLGGRYMGTERADEYGARNAVPGELLVRIRPTRVIAKRDIAD
jgi:PPOX class probable F420-dependent enzyme